MMRLCPHPVGRTTGFSHRVGASMANGLRPLYCPWPRCFVYHTIAWRGLHFALLCVARDLGWCDHEIIEALVGFCSPILLRPGFFLCTLDYEPAKSVHKKHNTHQSTNGPLPCTIEAITRSGTDIPSSRPTGPFSPNVGEEEFSEVHGSKLSLSAPPRHVDGRLRAAFSPQPRS